MTNSVSVFRSAVIVLILIPALVLSAAASRQPTAEDYICQMIRCYYTRQAEGQPEIERLLGHLEALDPKQAALWRNIMADWAWVNADMAVTAEVLPDGLPDDDSLCIVVMGFGLDQNGAMKPELLQRMTVAVRCAEKYPNAYILCTGGETASVPGVSEAEVMGQWLRICGIDEGRIILETESLTTTENARNSCRLLAEDYPTVTGIAIVTSDYHMRWSCSVFSAAAHYQSGMEGCRPLSIVGNAANITDTPHTDTLYSQAWGISIIAGVPFDTETEE